MTFPIQSFVRESNAIEGITRDPTDGEIKACMTFLELARVAVDDLEWFVSVCEPGAVLRDKPGLNVGGFGSHWPMPGGPQVRVQLHSLVESANRGVASAYKIHREYKHLHPFTYGNGRSGRILFAWMVERQGNDMLHELSFLHAWYWLSLDARR